MPAVRGMGRVRPACFVGPLRAQRLGCRNAERFAAAALQALRCRRVRFLVEGSGADGWSADAERAAVEAGFGAATELSNHAMRQIGPAAGAGGL